MRFISYFVYFLQKAIMNPDIRNVQLMVIIIIVVMLLLVTSMLLLFMIGQRKKTKYLLQMQQMRSEQQNMLIEAAVKSEETERHRIAEELHDDLGALLSATKLHFYGFSNAAFTTAQEDALARSKELLNDCIQKVRSISHNLHSSILKELGLNEGIRHFAEKLTKGSNISLQLDFDEAAIMERGNREITVYRLVQELVNNILKHAAATQIKITTTNEAQFFQLCIWHNGNGISQNQFEQLRYGEKGMGLKNIQNRIILLKGEIHFIKAAEEAKIEINIPKIPTT
jgi:signal transduction histidine kinase